MRYWWMLMVCNRQWEMIMLLMHRCFCSSCLFDLLIIMEIMEYFLAIYSVLYCYSNNQQDVSCLCFCFYTDYYSAWHTCQQTLQSKNLLNKSAFSFVHMLTTWHCLHSVYDATAAQHRWYQCLLPTGLTAANLQWQHAAATQTNR